MKQVYATGSLANATSATIHATSTGTSADTVSNLLPLASYQAQSIDGATLPVRLSLIMTPTTGRVLSHVASNGGNYFSHLLLDIPNTTDAHTAIQTWDSPQWQRHEPDSKNDLPELPFLPVADRLDEATLKAWLTVPDHRELLEYAIAAMLAAGTGKRVFLNASSDDVAMVVFAVTRAFPSNLTDDLTFSTYEPDPLNCSARLIGCDRTATGWELPDACFENGNFAFNPANARCTAIPTGMGFAAFAVNSFALGDLAALDEFRATWQRLGLTDASQFDLIDRLFRGTGVLNREEMTTALQSPAIALWVSARGDAVTQLTEWALDDRAFATGPFARVVQAMRPQAEPTGKLAEAIKQAGFEAVKAGNVTRAGNAFDVILPMIAPAKAQSIWGDVHQLKPSDLTWEMRWRLLPKLVRAKLTQSSSTSPADFAAWLDFPAEQFDRFLTLDLPKAYFVTAARAERPVEEMPVVAKALAKHPAVAMAALQPKSDADHERAALLFETLVVNEPSRNWFEESVRASADYPPPLLNRFFETELAKGHTDADRLIRTQGPTLLSLFAGRSGLETLGSRFLASPPADLLHQSGLLDFLTQLKTHARAELGERIAATLTVRDFLQSPHCDADRLAVVAKAIDLAPSPLPGSTKAELFQSLTTELGRRLDSTDFQIDYETVIASLGNSLAKGPTDLFQDLLRDLRAKPEFAGNTNAVSATLAIALGAVKSKDLVLDGLEPDAFAVAADAAKAGKAKLLDELDQLTGDWPKEAKAKWGFLKEAVRPPSSRVGRDVLCFLAGAVVVAAAWGIWWLVK